jgi:hypothetical protein
MLLEGYLLLLSYQQNNVIEEEVPEFLHAWMNLTIDMLTFDYKLSVLPKSLRFDLKAYLVTF